MDIPPYILDFPSPIFKCIIFSFFLRGSKIFVLGFFLLIPSLYSIFNQFFLEHLVFDISSIFAFFHKFLRFLIFFYEFSRFFRNFDVFLTFFIKFSRFFIDFDVFFINFYVFLIFFINFCCFFMNFCVFLKILMFF